MQPNNTEHEGICRNPDTIDKANVLKFLNNYIISSNLEMKAEALFEQLNNNSLEVQKHEESFINNNASLEQCAICLEKLFKSSECNLPCDHKFHIHCIWKLGEKRVSANCPLCRGKLTPLTFYKRNERHDDEVLTAMRKTVKILGDLYERTIKKFFELKDLCTNIYLALNKDSKDFLLDVVSTIHEWFSDPRNMTFMNKTSDEFNLMDKSELTWVHIQTLEEILHDDREISDVENAIMSRDLRGLIRTLGPVRRFLNSE